MTRHEKSAASVTGVCRVDASRGENDAVDLDGMDGVKKVCRRSGIEGETLQIHQEK